MKTRIETKLREKFAPLHLEVVDDSHLHVGHANYKPGGNTHFTITLVSPFFSNLTRVERHQCVYTCLEEELNDGVHAICLKTLCPEDAVELGALV
jgi:BolA protein